MSLTAISHRAAYDPATDLVIVPATDGEQNFMLTIAGTTLMDREGVAGLDASQILELTTKYRDEVGETAEILRRNGQVGPHNEIDILVFEP